MGGKMAPSTGSTQFGCECAAKQRKAKITKSEAFAL